MAYSMTGIGRATGEMKKPPARFDVEIKSSNHRFLELSIKLPGCLTPFEDEIRKIIQERVTRGHVIVSVQLDRDILNNRFEIDESLLQAYLALARELKRNYRARGAIDINTLLAIPGLIRASQNPVDAAGVFGCLKPVIKRALAGFLAMKKREGDLTAAEIRRSLKIIVRGIRDVARLVPARNEEYRKRLFSIQKEFGEKIDKERLYQEILYLSDRADITEEIKRLKSHLQLATATLYSDPHPGRRLNFLLQEMQREANTAGVKANYLKISEIVVTMKEEIEKIREQVQNIE